MTPYQTYKPPSDALSTPISHPPNDRSYPAGPRPPLGPAIDYTPNHQHTRSDLHSTPAGSAAATAPCDAGRLLPTPHYARQPLAGKSTSGSGNDHFDSYRTVYNPTPITLPKPHSSSLASYHYHPPSKVPFATPTPQMSGQSGPRHLYTPTSTFTFSSPHQPDQSHSTGRPMMGGQGRSSHSGHHHQHPPSSPSISKPLRMSGPITHPTLPALPDLFTPRGTPSLSRTPSLQTPAPISTMLHSSPSVNPRKRKSQAAAQTPVPPPRHRRMVRASDGELINVGCLMAPATPMDPLPEAFVLRKPAIESSHATLNPNDYIPAPKRIKNSIEQLEFLWTVWDIHHMPRAPLKERVGVWLGLPTHNVTIWLQNNRQYLRGQKKDKKTLWSVHDPRKPSAEERAFVNAVMNGTIKPEDVRPGRNDDDESGLMTPSTAANCSPGSTGTVARGNLWPSPPLSDELRGAERPAKKQARRKWHTPDSDEMGGAPALSQAEPVEAGAKEESIKEEADAAAESSSEESGASDDEHKGEMVAAEAAHILMTLMVPPKA